MKRNSFALDLVLAATMVVMYPSTGISQTPRQNSEARRLVAEGVEFQYDGSFAEAEKKFREALTKYPKAERSDRTAYYLIDTLVKLGRVQDARTRDRALPQELSDVEMAAGRRRENLGSWWTAKCSTGGNLE